MTLLRNWKETTANTLSHLLHVTGKDWHPTKNSLKAYFHFITQSFQGSDHCGCETWQKLDAAVGAVFCAHLRYFWLQPVFSTRPINLSNYFLRWSGRTLAEHGRPLFASLSRKLVAWELLFVYDRPYPVSLWYSAARIQRDITMVGFPKVHRKRQARGIHTSRDVVPLTLVSKKFYFSLRNLQNLSWYAKKRMHSQKYSRFLFNTKQVFFPNRWPKAVFATRLFCRKCGRLGKGKV